MRRPVQFHSLGPAIAVLCAVLVVYAPARHFGLLNWDDPGYVTDNPYLADTSWRGGLRLWAPDAVVMGNWAPVTVASLWLDQALDPTPQQFHRTSVVLHAISTLLSFWVFRLIGLGRVTALFAALFFGLHPIAVASVAWVSERKNVLSTALGLAALGAGMGAPEADRNAGRWQTPVALLLFTGALAAKATVVGLPCILVAIWHARDGVALKPALARAAPFVALALIMALITWRAQSAAGGIVDFWGGSFWSNLATAARMVWVTLSHYAWPTQLAAVYRPAASESLAEPAVVASLVGLGILAAALVWSRRRAPRAWIFGVWYASAILPVANLVPLPHLVADRFFYWPSIGVAGLLGWAGATVLARLGSDTASALVRRWSTGFVVGLGVCMVVAAAFATRARLPVWRDSESLWLDTIAKTPNAAVAHANLGLCYAERGEHGRAIPHYQRALALRPDLQSAAVNLANALHRTGQRQEALAQHRRAARAAPGDPNAQYNLGAALLDAGDEDGARAAFERALALDTNHAPALTELGRMALKRQDLGGALELLARATAVPQPPAEAHYLHGLALGRARRTDAALEALEQAVELEPTHARARLQFAMALAATGRTEAARHHIQEALAQDPTLDATIPEVVRRDLGLEPR